MIRAMSKHVATPITELSRPRPMSLSCRLIINVCLCLYA